MLAEIDRFVHWVRRRSLEARTWKDYTYDLRLFARLIGDRPLGQVTFWDIDRFVAWQVERGFQPLPSTAVWLLCSRSTRSCRMRIPSWYAPSSEPGITCENRSGCHAQFRRTTCGGSSPRWTTPGTGRCSS